MPEIVGKFSILGTSLPSLDAHVAHLSHLTNPKAARELLAGKHGMTASDSRATAPLLSAHIRQALDFHRDSVSASDSTRPVLQYYCYLNLAVAVILAYRPVNYNRYRQHGVEDQTHSLASVTLSSKLLRVKRGAVPLFHSIISDIALEGVSFRLGQTLSGFRMVSSELQDFYHKKSEVISVHDKVVKDNGKWFAEFCFTCFRDQSARALSRRRIERTIPTLGDEYVFERIDETTLVYRSSISWTTKLKATSHQRKHGLKLINFGGHELVGEHPDHTSYFWRGLANYKYLPTLTCVLLTSFAFASISRYRPVLVASIANSPIQLLHSVFMLEADSVFVPAVRNLLYREETFVVQNTFT